MTEADFKCAVAEILGPEGEGFYIEGESRPWVIVCGEPYEFERPEAALEKAEQLLRMG